MGYYREKEEQEEEIMGGEGDVSVTVKNSFAFLEGECEGSEMIEAAKKVKAFAKAKAEKERVEALEEARRLAKKEKKGLWKKAKRQALSQGRPQAERVYVDHNHEVNNQNGQSDLNHGELNGNNNQLRRANSHPAQNGGGNNSYVRSNGHVNPRGYQQNHRGGDYKNQAYNNGNGGGYRGASRHSSDRSVESSGERKGNYVNNRSNFSGGYYNNGMRRNGKEGYNGHDQDVVSYQVETQGQDGIVEENDSNWWMVESGRGRRGRYIQVFDDNFGQEGQFVEKQIGNVQFNEDSILKEKKEGELVNGDDVDIPAEGESNLSTEDGKESSNESNKSAQDDTKKDGEKTFVYEPKTMTLKEYEKIQLEKKKALESLIKEQQREHTIDKDFESMQLVKKETDDLSINRVSKKEETLNKKGSLQEEKTRQMAKTITVGFRFPPRPKPPIRGGERTFAGQDRSKQLDGSLAQENGDRPNEKDKKENKLVENEGPNNGGQERPNDEDKGQYNDGQSHKPNVGNRVDGVVVGERANDKPINAVRGSGWFSNGGYRGRGRGNTPNFHVDDPRQFPALGEKFINTRRGGYHGRGRPPIGSVRPH